MNCYQCIYRGNVPGDAHSCCRYPGADTDIFHFFSDENSKLRQKLGIKIDRHGFMSGWAFWPVNFDPVWIDNCGGYREKERKHAK